MNKRLKQRWLVNLGLLLAISLLLALALLQNEPAEKPKITLGHYLPSDINEVRIMRTGKHDIHFELRSNDWHMLTPYQARAEQNLVKQILSMSGLEVSAVIEQSSAPPAKFGLHEPAVSIQLNQQIINFGGSQAIGKRRYVETKNKIMLVPDRLMTQLKIGSVSYIDRHLIPAGTKPESLDNK